MPQNTYMCKQTENTQVEVQYGPRVTVASVQEADQGGDVAVECRAEVLFYSFLCN